jgi:hypothetical protein
MTSWLEQRCGAGNDCRRAALSCFSDLQHAREILAVAPARRGQHIAKARLSSEHGRAAQTGRDPCHMSLWLQRSWLERAPELFKVVP